jgi:hypothetical protein
MGLARSRLLTAIFHLTHAWWQTPTISARTVGGILGSRLTLDLEGCREALTRSDLRRRHLLGFTIGRQACSSTVASYAEIHDSCGGCSFSVCATPASICRRTGLCGSRGAAGKSSVLVSPQYHRGAGGEHYGASIKQVSASQVVSCFAVSASARARVAK